jgi:hypothetical protein
MRNCSVLPLGKINLKTGNSKYFNVYDTWGEDTTYEVYRVYEGFRIVATSGKSPLCGIGDRRGFQHDQNRRFLFEGVMVDFATGTELKSLVEKYGNSISGYTYK